MYWQHLTSRTERTPSRSQKRAAPKVFWYMACEPLSFQLKHEHDASNPWSYSKIFQAWSFLCKGIFEQSCDSLFVPKVWNVLGFGILDVLAVWHQTKNLFFLSQWTYNWINAQIKTRCNVKECGNFFTFRELFLVGLTKACFLIGVDGWENRL